MKKSVVDVVLEMTAKERKQRLKTAMAKVRSAKGEGLNYALMARLVRKFRRIRHEPHYSQEVWFRQNSCGTAMCIAGHGLAEIGVTPVELQIMSTHLSGGALQPARIAMGLGLQTARKLFDGLYWDGSAPPAWPIQYRKRWERHRERRSRIAADLLQDVINNKGKMPKSIEE